MGVERIEKNLSYSYHSHTDKPIIEKIKIVKGDEKSFSLTSHLIVFVLKGKTRYFSRSMPSTEVTRGQVLLIAPENYTYKALKTSEIIFFRVNESIRSYIKLASEKEIKAEINTSEPIKKPGQLKINSRLWFFIHGVNFCISNWTEHNVWSEVKIQEFFIIIQTTYSQKNIQNFLYTTHHKDMAFSEYVHSHWKKYNTVQELADSMHMTPKRFSAKFLSVFGITPHKWIMQKRASIVYQEITTTSKLFKQIAVENGFSSDSLLTRFCKKIFNLTPTQIREGQ